MRPEYLAARLTAQGVKYTGAGVRGTAAYEDLRAYLGRVSRPAFVYALIVYFGEASETNIKALVRNVRLEVSRDWKDVGVRPRDAAALRKWRAKNAGLMERMTLLAVTEALKPTEGAPKKAQWRAQQFGVSERTWRHEYRDRYDRIWAVLNDWDGEFCGKVWVNQREPEEA